MKSFLKAIKEEEKNFYEKGVKISYEKLKNLVQYLNEKFDTNKEINDKLESMKKDVSDIKSQLDSVVNDLQDAKRFTRGIQQIKKIESSAANYGLNNSIFDFFKKNNFISEESEFKEGENSEYEIVMEVPKYEDKEVKFTFKSDDKASSGIKSVTLADKGSEENQETKKESGFSLNKLQDSTAEMGPKLQSTENKKETKQETKNSSNYNEKVIVDKIGLYNKIKDQCLETTRGNLDTVISKMNSAFYNNEDVNSINSMLIKVKEDYKKYKERELYVNKNAFKPEIVVSEIYNNGGEKGSQWNEYVKQANNVKIKENEKEKKRAAKEEKGKEKEENETQNIRNYIKNFLDELESMSESVVSFDYKKDVDEIDKKIHSNENEESKNENDKNSSNNELELKSKKADESDNFVYETKDENDDGEITKTKIKSGCLESLGLNLKEENSEGEENSVLKELFKGDIKKEKKLIAFTKAENLSTERYNKEMEKPVDKRDKTMFLDGEVEFPKIFYYISNNFKTYIHEQGMDEENRESYDKLKEEYERKDEPKNEKQNDQSTNESAEQPTNTNTASEGNFQDDGSYSSTNGTTSLDDIDPDSLNVSGD